MDFLFSQITRTLTGILDPYETPKVVGAALAEIMPIVTRERPDILKKIQAMQKTPLEIIFRGCIRAGFPTTMQFG
jgi:hypothetical protein